ncbi:cell cycle RNA binding protein whi3, partial [Ascosphaera atra]
MADEDHSAVGAGAPNNMQQNQQHQQQQQTPKAQHSQQQQHQQQPAQPISTSASNVYSGFPTSFDLSSARMQRHSSLSAVPTLAYPHSSSIQGAFSSITPTNQQHFGQPQPQQQQPQHPPPGPQRSLSYTVNNAHLPHSPISSFFSAPGSASAGINGLGASSGATPSSNLLIRHLPSATTPDTLRAMLLFATGLVGYEIVENPPEDMSFYATAIARFRDHESASEAREKLHGKPNAAGDGNMIVEFAGPSAIANARRNNADLASSMHSAQQGQASSQGSLVR